MAKSHSDTLGPDIRPSSYGLRALFAELATQGVDAKDVLSGTGLDADYLENSNTLLQVDQRITIFRNARRFSERPDIALRAGTRQTISDFGFYGFAMASSRTMAEAMDFGFQHLELAGPVLHITRTVLDDVIILRSHNPQSLGDLLPFVAEFWRSSMSTLQGHVLGRPFPSKAMYFPYAAPAHASAYREVFTCPVNFGSDRMEWHIHESVRQEECPNASVVSARICQKFCEQVLTTRGRHSLLQREIKAICLGYQGRFPTAPEVATQMGVSTRTLYRRLGEEGVSYSSVVDGVRCSIATAYLANTRLSVEEIAGRTGFSDPSNFRKAFRRWTGKVPSYYRREPMQQVRI